MARYRIISEHGAYMPRSPEVVRLELGSDNAAARAYGVRAQVCELLREGTEVEYAGTPGPHLEPLDEAARTAMAAYWTARPGATLDPTRSLPLGRDPLVTATFESATLAMLERMAAESAAGSSGQSSSLEQSALRATVSGQDAKLDALTEAMTKLAGIVAQLATPTPPTQPRKAA